MAGRYGMTFAAKLSGRSFSWTRAPCASSGALSRVFAITSSSSTSGASAGSELERSRRWPCETTIAETLTSARTGQAQGPVPWVLVSGSGRSRYPTTWR